MRRTRAVLIGLAVILILGIALTSGPKEAAVPLFSGLAGGATVVALILLISHFRR
jgi:hypothetical protein